MIHSHREYRKLVEEMIEHDRRYYDETMPVISDYEYDQKMAALIAYEKAHPEQIDPNSPAQRVAESPTEGFEQREHLVPMYSLANTYSENEVSDFVKRVHKLLGHTTVSFCCELKMDGAAISLLYKKGRLSSATTRGNGKKGDDVTANIKTIKSIPLQLTGRNVPDLMEVRGEIYLSLATFRALNAAREEEGLEPFANPRNAAAGSLKLLDPKEVAKRKLQCVTYGIAENMSPVATQHEVHQYLHEVGFPTSSKEHLRVAHDLAAIMKFAESVQKQRPHLPFEIDGIVVKVNELKHWDLLGHTGKVPRFAIAYKFAPEQAHTKIHDITVQVGRSGVMTPVAELEPVFLSGSTISRATLHNQDEVARKDIRIGDFVIIEKGGDVIPKVVSVDLSKRLKSSHPWHMPKHCPICGSHVTKRENEVAVRCPNPRCEGQRVRRIIYFASKHALDIDHMGEKVVQLLVEKGLISRPSDIYLLNEEKLQTLEGFKEKSISNLLSSIDASRKCPLSRFIMGLAIPSVGSETAELLAAHAKDLNHLLACTVEELVAIEGIGEKTAKIIYTFLHETENVQEIELLLAHGVRPQKSETKKIGNHPFSGKTFVITGTLSHYSRDEAARLIKERGGKVSGSVSKQTDWLLLGDEPGSKYEKAKELHIPIMDEAEFQKGLTR